MNRRETYIRPERTPWLVWSLVVLFGAPVAVAMAVVR